MTDHVGFEETTLPAGVSEVDASGNIAVFGFNAVTHRKDTDEITAEHS